MSFVDFIVVVAFIFLMVDCCAGLLGINKFNGKLICVLAVEFLVFAGGLFYVAFG